MAKAKRTPTARERQLLDWGVLPPKDAMVCECGRSYLWVWLADGRHVCNACRRVVGPDGAGARRYD
jgi:hypothetical protein